MSRLIDEDDIIFIFICLLMGTICLAPFTIVFCAVSNSKAYRRGVIEAQVGEVYVEQVGTKHGGPVWGPVQERAEE